MSYYILLSFSDILQEQAIERCIFVLMFFSSSSSILFESFQNTSVVPSTDVVSFVTNIKSKCFFN